LLDNSDLVASQVSRNDTATLSGVATKKSKNFKTSPLSTLSKLKNGHENETLMKTALCISNKTSPLLNKPISSLTSKNRKI
jgi:hypothetical protein